MLPSSLKIWIELEDKSYFEQNIYFLYKRIKANKIKLIIQAKPKFCIKLVIILAPE